MYSLPLSHAFLCIASARLPLLGFSVFSVFASSGHFCYAFCWLAMQSCSLVVCVAPGAFLKAVYAGYHGYALPEARYAGETVGQSPGHRAASLGCMQCIGQGDALGIPRVRLVSGFGYENFTKTLS